jgi:uncharacterized protein
MSTATVGLSLPVPQPNPDSLAYWEAARQQRLVIQQCKSCGTRHFMARSQCPSCWSDQLEWVDCAGTGTIYSFSVVHRASMPEFAAIVPYVVALIELDEGPRMFANVVGERALEVGIGDRVKVCFEVRGDDGAKLPQFTPLI